MSTTAALFEHDDDLILADQFSSLIFIGRLAWLLEQGDYARFRQELPAASQEQIMAAIGFAGKVGNVPALALLVGRLAPTSKVNLAKLIHTLAPDAVEFLLGVPHLCILPTVHDITGHMKSGTLSPIVLAVLLRSARGLLYLVEAPQPMAGLAGWGMATMFIRRNEIYAQYAAVIAGERQRVRQHLWRVLFWGAVLRIRIVQFQARYWGPGGAGYLAAKASFEAARALHIKKNN
jgi:hypothetical protein